MSMTQSHRFRTWEEFDSFTHDLAVFGTNQVELAHFRRRGAGPDVDVEALAEFSSRLDKVSATLTWRVGGW